MEGQYEGLHFTFTISLDKSACRRDNIKHKGYIHWGNKTGIITPMGVCTTPGDRPHYHSFGRAIKEITPNQDHTRIYPPPDDVTPNDFTTINLWLSYVSPLVVSPPREQKISPW